MTSEAQLEAWLLKKGYRLVRQGHLIVALPLKTKPTSGSGARDQGQALEPALNNARSWRVAAHDAERRAVHLAMRIRVLEAALLAAGLPLPSDFAEVCR